MKKIVSLLLSLCVLASVFAYEDQPHPRSKGGSRYVLKQASALVQDYKRSVPADEVQKTADYLQYFRSFAGKQSVTPPPAGLYDDLEPASKEFIGKINDIASKFMKTPEPMMPGASRLSDEGVVFYQNVIKELQISVPKTALRSHLVTSSMD